jgi:hypothetical protein
MAHLEKEINSLLLALVSFDTQVAEKRDAMLTGLARRAAQGAADIKGTQFLAEYGLDSYRCHGGPVQHPPFAAELAAFLEGFVRDSRH